MARGAAIRSGVEAAPAKSQGASNRAPDSGARVRRAERRMLSREFRLRDEALPSRYRFPMVHAFHFLDQPLPLIELIIWTAPLQQLLMAPLLDDFTGTQVNDEIRGAHGRNPMRYQQRCPPLHEFLELGQDFFLGLDVDARKRVIQD